MEGTSLDRLQFTALLILSVSLAAPRENGAAARQDFAVSGMIRLGHLCKQERQPVQNKQGNQCAANL